MKKTIALVGSFIFVLTFLIMIANVNAQNQGGFSASAGIAIPLGDFGDDAGNVDDGFAQIGFFGELNYVHFLEQNNNLGWASTGGLILNSVDESDFGQDVDISPYLNIPLLTGLRYQSQTSGGMGIYGLGQVGLNLSKGPSFEFNGNEQNSNMVASFGFGLGAGLIFNNQFNVGIRYLGLGEPEYEYEDQDGNSIGEMEQPISMLQISIGISF